MKLFVLFLFAAATTESSAFLYSDTPTGPDCMWLPWQYIACIRSGRHFRKLENRTKISLHGSGSCSSETDSRTTESCTAAEYVASTVLTTLSNRRQAYTGGGTRTVLFGQPGSALKPMLRPDIIAYNPVYSPAWARPTTISFTTTTTSEPRYCGSTFTDHSTGIKMLGANCRRRHRRNADEKEVKSRQKRQFGGNVESLLHRDILFLLDESGSVGPTNFKKELEFVEALVEKLDTPRQLGRSETRVALTTFSENYAHRIDLLDSVDLRSFKNALNRVSYRSNHDSSTCLIDALRAARDEVFTTNGGSRVPRGGADGLVILVTDGCLNCNGGNVKKLLQTEQAQFEEMGISILTFMINVGGRCEKSFTALQDGSSCFQGYSYPSWREFEKLIDFFRNMEGKINRWTKNNEQCP